MKIEKLEKWCEENKNYSYEYRISDDNEFVFADLHTGRCAIFEDDIKKLKSYLKRNGWRVQYMYYSGKDIAYAIITNK